MRHPFRRKYLAPRLFPVYVAVVAVVVLAAPTAANYAAGLAVAAAGVALRAWAAGHLEKNRALCQSGPYARIRNPLYAGTLLVGCGFAFAAGGAASGAIVLVVMAAFFGYYLPYKERIESARLERRFGAAYTGYRAAVPSLLPAFSRRAPSQPEAARTRWSVERFNDNDELATELAIAAGFATLAARAGWLA